MQNVFATLIWAAEKEEPSGVDLLLPTDLNEVWAGLVAFAVVFFVIWKFAVPAFNELLANRQAAIQGDLEAAEQAKLEAQSLRDDYQAQIAGARDEANRIIEEARSTADDLKTDAAAKAEADAAAIRARAQEEIAGERDRAAAALRDDVATLSLDVAEKVVGRSLDRDAQQALVNQFIDELGGVGN